MDCTREKAADDFSSRSGRIREEVPAPKGNPCPSEQSRPDASVDAEAEACARLAEPSGCRCAERTLDGQADESRHRSERLTLAEAAMSQTPVLNRGWEGYVNVDRGEVMVSIS